MLLSLDVLQANDLVVLHAANVLDFDLRDVTECVLNLPEVEAAVPTAGHQNFVRVDKRKACDRVPVSLIVGLDLLNLLFEYEVPDADDKVLS